MSGRNEKRKRRDIMSKEREIRLPQIVLKQTMRDGDEVKSVPVTAKDLLLQALSDSGGKGFGYDDLRKRIPVSNAVEALKKNESLLLDEEGWKLLCMALESHKWGWVHVDILKVVDAVKDAEQVEVELKKGKNRK